MVEPTHLFLLGGTQIDSSAYIEYAFRKGCSGWFDLNLEFSARSDTDQGRQRRVKHESEK